MCVCVCVCVCVGVAAPLLAVAQRRSTSAEELLNDLAGHACIHTTCTCIHTCMHPHHMHMHPYMHASIPHTHASIHACIHTTHTCIHTCMHPYHIHMHPYMHASTHAYMHTYLHTLRYDLAGPVCALLYSSRQALALRNPPLGVEAGRLLLDMLRGCPPLLKRQVLFLLLVIVRGAPSGEHLQLLGVSFLTSLLNESHGDCGEEVATILCAISELHESSRDRQ